MSTKAPLKFTNRTLRPYSINTDPTAVDADVPLVQVVLGRWKLRVTAIEQSDDTLICAEYEEQEGSGQYQRKAMITP